MNNQSSSRRYRFNDVNNSQHISSKRKICLVRPVKKEVHEGNDESHKSSPNPFLRSFANKPTRKTHRALHGDRRIHIYMYIRATTSRTRRNTRAAGPFVSLPPRTSPTKRMHFGCSCEFVRASNASECASPNCLCAVTSASVGGVGDRGRSSVVRSGVESGTRAQPPGIA